jgi:hypothetical protein
VLIRRATQPSNCTLQSTKAAHETSDDVNAKQPNEAASLSLAPAQRHSDSWHATKPSQVLVADAMGVQGAALIWSVSPRTNVSNGKARGKFIESFKHEFIEPSYTATAGVSPTMR